MRKLELVMEERRAEREDSQEERIMASFASLIHPMMGGYMYMYMHGPPVQHEINYSPPTQPFYFNVEQPGSIPYPDSDND